MKRYWQIPLCLTLILSGCGHDDKPAAKSPAGAARAKPDTSLTVDEYKAQGMPAIDKPWTNDDYDKALRVIAALAKSDPAKLPGAGSEKSGAVVARIVSHDNLPPPGSGFRTQNLMGIVGDLAFIQSNYVRQDPSAVGPTICELAAFGLYASRAMMEAFADELAKSQGADHRIAETNRARATESVARGVHIVGIMAADWGSFNRDQRTRVADAALENVPELLSCIKPAEVEEFHKTLAAAAAQESGEELKAKLLSLSTIKPVEIKAAPPVVSAAAAAAGQDSPENALRAYVRVLRDGDFEGYKAVFSQNPEKVGNYVGMIEGLAKDHSPAAIEWEKSGNLEVVAAAGFPDGHYRVFPAEIQGDDASIVKVVDSRAEDRPGYVRYFFKRIGGKWYLMDENPVDRQTIDTTKYPREMPQVPDWAEEGPKNLLPSRPKETPRPAFTMTDVEFVRAFESDAKKAAAKYANLWIELDGTVFAPYSWSDYGLMLGRFEKTKSGFNNWSVNCELVWPEKRRAKELATTQKVKVLGRFVEGNSTANLVECRIISVGPDPSIHVSAAALAAEFLANHDAFEKKYENKQLVVDGIVDAVEKYKSGVEVRLKGAAKDGKPLPVAFTSFRTQTDEALRLAKGEAVRIAGECDSAYSDNVAISSARLQAVPAPGALKGP